jgi:hypothetical protein
MSYQNFDQFQAQPTGEQPGAQPAQPDMGQQMDPSGPGFPAGNMGPPGGPQDGQQDGSGKTTLW